ncbi:ATPases of the AAA+ class [Ruminococcaceae bacterium YRB3002]|nr:ATPases of the AAA+ class [Ruminococcaceae bacterium YRB3002]
MSIQKDSIILAYTNTVKLDIASGTDHESGARRAYRACDRFIGLGSQQKDGQAIAWQMDTETGVGYLLAGDGVKVSIEDYRWAIGKIGEVSSMSRSQIVSDVLQDLWADGRRVYEITRCEEERFTCDCDGDCTFMRSLLDILSGIGGVLLFAFSGENGSVMVSIREEIPLRIISTLSIGFPEFKVTEVMRDSRKITGCTIHDLRRLMGCAMSAAIAEACGEAGDCCRTKTVIEDMGLSVRAYNCLKRYGINTVEELDLYEDDELLKFRNLSPKILEEIRGKQEEYRRGLKPREVKSGISCSTVKLDGLVGLESVKEQVKKITAFARMKADLKKQGRPDVPVSLNMQFTGNPGTAKTTVARILAEVFCELGLLNSGEPVEVGRADLIASYMGQTADKVKKVFERADGKLLFIDEAYSLIDGQRGEYGDEAVSTIVQEMENRRDRTIVIFAGYPDEMEDFIALNPGLRSRVPFTLRFDDYSVDEMVRITGIEAERRGFAIDSKAMAKVSSLCAKAAHRPDMGNGRFCRNLIEHAILDYASRVYGSSGDTGPVVNDFTLVAEDFAMPEEDLSARRAGRPIGFGLAS